MQPHFVYQVSYHFQRHFRIIQQTHGFAFFPFLQAFGQRIDKFLAYFFIQVKLRIAGKLYGISLDRIVVKNKEDILQA